jgi:hypothetical protein
MGRSRSCPVIKTGGNLMSPQTIPSSNQFFGPLVLAEKVATAVHNLCTQRCAFIAAVCLLSITRR